MRRSVVPAANEPNDKGRNMSKAKFVLFAMLVSVASAIAVGQTVSVNFNQSQSFAQYHTYAWGSNNTNQIQNSILAQVAQQDIDTALQGKGLQKVQEDQKPDLLLTASGGMKEQTSYTAMGMRGWGGGMGSITPQQNVIGTMIVDLFDIKTQSLVWRGIAQDTLSTNGNKNQQIVQKARRCSSGGRRLKLLDYIPLLKSDFNTVKVGSH
jgi:hypothetical protein